MCILSQFVLFLILGGCATIGAGRPDWVLQPPQDSMNLYFVGIASGTKTLQEGHETALKDALGKIANYLGTRVKSSYQQIVNEIEQRLEVQISADSDAQIKEANLLEWSVKENNSLFDVYALVKISKARLKEELARQEKENTSKAEVSYGIYLRGLDEIYSKDYKEASSLFKQAVEILEPIQNVTSPSLGDFRNSRELYVRIKEKLRNVSLAQKKLSFELSFPESESLKEAFMSRFASALSREGFVVDEAEPTFKVGGKIVSRESGFVIENFVYYAEGSLTIKIVSNGRVAGVIPITAKALGKTRQISAMNAFNFAGSKAGDDLTNLLISLEKK